MYSVRVLSRNCSLHYGENLTAEKAAEVIFPNITRSRERESCCAKMTSLCIKNVRPRFASCRPTRVMRINKACNKREGGELYAGDKERAIPRPTRKTDTAKLARSFGEARSERYVARACIRVKSDARPFSRAKTRD